jgi:hypothetical protein
MGDSGRKHRSKNGGKMEQNGRHRERDTSGRFVRGYSGGPGRPRNPYGRRCAALRAAFVDAVSVGDVKRVAKKLAELAQAGDPVGLRLFLAILGPVRPVDPDYILADELEVRRATPTHLDWMVLDAEEFRASAGDHADDLTEDQDDEDLDGDPEADDTPEPDPDDPLAAWEQFAAARLEWGEAWGTPLDWLYGAYARWCGAYGKPLLSDADVLTWLQARGARLTGSGSSSRWVQGLRVTD